VRNKVGKGGWWRKRRGERDTGVIGPPLSSGGLWPWRVLAVSRLAGACHEFVRAVQPDLRLVLLQPPIPVSSSSSPPLLLVVSPCVLATPCAPTHAPQPLPTSPHVCHVLGCLSHCIACIFLCVASMCLDQRMACVRSYHDRMLPACLAVD